MKYVTKYFDTEEYDDLEITAKITGRRVRETDPQNDEEPEIIEVTAKIDGHTIDFDQLPESEQYRIENEIIEQYLTEEL